MELSRRSWLYAGLTLPLLGRSAPAQSFPENRPIRWVVPFPPGGQTDSTARLTAQGLATALPANIVVDNRVGGQGTVGSDQVRQSPPDGHTLLCSASIFALGRHVLKGTRYDPQADFQPVARVGEAPLLFLAANSVPANTLAELIASARREPQRYSFALSSLGSAGHLAAIEFNRLAGVDISMVPYRGAAAALNDVISDSVQLYIDAGVASLQHVRAGRMKVLAITTAERSPLAPDVPTAAESGMPGLVFCTLLSFYDFLAWANVYELRLQARAAAAQATETGSGSASTLSTYIPIGSLRYRRTSSNDLPCTARSKSRQNASH